MNTMDYQIIDAGDTKELVKKVKLFLDSHAKWSLVGPVQVTVNGPSHWFYQTLVQEF